MIGTSGWDSKCSIRWWAGPVAAAVGLIAECAAEVLQRVRPRDPLGRTLRRLAGELVVSCLGWTGASPTPRTCLMRWPLRRTTRIWLLGAGDVAAERLARAGPSCHERHETPRQRNHPRRGMATVWPVLARARPSAAAVLRDVAQHRKGASNDSQGHDGSTQCHTAQPNLSTAAEN